MARALGRRRAAAGLTLPDVIEAYHIAYREIWNELVTRATTAGPETASALTREVAPLWKWLHVLSATVAETHADLVRVRHTTRAALRRRFLSALVAQPFDITESRGLARELGFDINSRFVVACAEGVPETTLHALLDELSGSGRMVEGEQESGRVVLVAQGYTDEELSDALQDHAAGVRVGVGLSREDISGAALSLADAQDALGRARITGFAVRFSDDWLLSVLSATGERLTPILERCGTVARENPALAETVQALAAARWSVTACARLLRIHPNSAKYRLDRWRALTGQDPHSFHGMVTSFVAMGLLVTDGPPAPLPSGHGRGASEH
jgi:sugar diacid utilization regulator